MAVPILIVGGKRSRHQRCLGHDRRGSPFRERAGGGPTAGVRNDPAIIGLVPPAVSLLRYDTKLDDEAAGRCFGSTRCAFPANSRSREDS